MRCRVVVAFVSLAMGCTRKAPAPTTPPAPAASVSVGAVTAGGSAAADAVAADAAATVASTEAEGGTLQHAYPPTYPLPKAPPGANPEHVMFANALCPATYRMANGKPAIGCRVHSPFVEPSRWPDGKLELFSNPDLTYFCGIERILHGSFSKPGAKQALVVFDACQDGSTWDMANPGSAVLAEEIDGKWREVDDAEDVNAGACKATKVSGRDVLFCQSGFGAFGIGDMSYVFTLDFGRPGKHANTVLRVYDDMFDCSSFQNQQETLPGGIVTAKIRSITFADRNGDGIPDAIVDVDRGRLNPSPQLDARAKAACTSGGAKALAPTPTHTRLEILSSGEDFAPSPAAEALLDKWAAESPWLTQLRGAAPSF